MKGKVKVEISDIPAGQYRLEIYKVGYHVNDTYSTYLDMGKPHRLSREQVNEIKKLNDRFTISAEIINVRQILPFPELWT